MGDNNNTTATADAAAHAFIARWQHCAASELASAQSFVIELCALLDVPQPHPTPEQDYMFERPVTFRYGDGTSSAGRIDCYKRGHFVLEAKKLKAGAHTASFDDGLLRARSQGENYVRALPATEGRPPFVLVLDVGTVIELYAEFSVSGGTYLPFPDPRSHRIKLAELVRPEIRQRLRQVWCEPHSLNPARISAQVTREVAQLLAQLAKSLESSPADASIFKPNKALKPAAIGLLAPEIVAAFLTRCLFSMFAEDVGLLPKGSFLGLLQNHRADPSALQQMLRILWADMDGGGFSAALAQPVLKFNGKLFKNSNADGYSLRLNAAQIELLIQAAQANWREVEPAIFGTLLERALNPAERHALGAHFTPRAYVERLVLPTVIEPLRADWANAQAGALVLAREAAELAAHPVQIQSKADFASADRHAAAVRSKWQAARQLVKNFHHQLCCVRVLDPACGSGNFLYVTLEHLKRLEGEVLNQLGDLGESQDALALGGETVTLQQLRGIEVNERAAALAELVLWIGYLQWHIRTQGHAGVAEPVVHDYGNIECRDAVLAWRERSPARSPVTGAVLTRWDGSSVKAHPVTGASVPDEAAQVVQWHYTGAQSAPWPQADFVIGNPPFIGKLKLRDALGDGYVQALRAAWPQVPDSADFVMHWWAHAAALTAQGRLRRFGFITTNSITMIFNRRVVQAALDGAGTTDAGKLSLLLAIADHPWVDSSNGAAVRIAMTVVAAANTTAPPDEANLAANGRLLRVASESTGAYGEVDVTLSQQIGTIHADLSIGANVTEAQALQANQRMSSTGVIPHGAGMLVTPSEAAQLEPDAPIKPYCNGKDLTNISRNMGVIDCYGLTAEEVRERFPKLYQWLLDRVKPEREVNRDKDLREKWWLHRRNNDEMRKTLAGLPRFIATVMTAKHRVFQFLDGAILPDQKLVVIGSDDAFHLGVLSSCVHVVWALALGGHLGVGNDPVYSKSTCFDTFAFPDTDTGLTPELRQSIRTLAEQIDAHRKRVLCPPPVSATAAKALTLTALYNVVQALREGRALTPKEKIIHTQGLAGVLQDLHAELDHAVLRAYGWADLSVRHPDDAQRTELLARLLALNVERRAQEAQGTVRWLRPEFQNSLSNKELKPQIQQGFEIDFAQEKTLKNESNAVQPWPATLPEQVRAVAQVLADSTHPLTLEALAAHFKGRGAWKKSLPTLLQTLEALGRAQRLEQTGVSLWRG